MMTDRQFNTIGDMYYREGLTCLYIATDMCIYLDTTKPENIQMLKQVDNMLKLHFRDRRLFGSFDVTKNDIAMWLDANQYMITTLWETELFEYKPIENYDNTTKETITVTRDLSLERNSEDTAQNSGIDKTTTTTSNHTVSSGEDSGTINHGSGVTTDTTKVAAYDSNTAKLRDEITKTSNAYSDTDNHISTGDINVTGSNIASREDNTKQVNTGTETTADSGTITTTREYKQSGNIGVTTSQQMIESQRQVAQFSAALKIAGLLANAISYGGYCYI